MIGAPFRIGATSFLHPESWLPNVERLAGRVDDVEILLFEPADGVPDAEEIEGLIAWKRKAGLSYTVHTPLDVSLASESAARRDEGVEQVCRAIEVGRPLDPFGYIVHVYLGDHEGDTVPTDLAAWRRRAAQSLEAILRRGTSPRDLCVETLDYDFAHIAPVVEDLGLSIALDLGHHHRDGRSEQAALLRHLPRTRVIQWHGVEPGGRDHRSLRHYPRARARAVIDALFDASYEGVLTLEVFREPDLIESLDVVRTLIEERVQ